MLRKSCAGSQSAAHFFLWRPGFHAKTWVLLADEVTYSRPKADVSGGGALNEWLDQPILLLSIAIIVVFGRVFWQARTQGDFGYHMGETRQIQATGVTIRTPHILYHLMIMGFEELRPGTSDEVLPVLPVVLCTLLLGHWLYGWLKRTINGGTAPVWVVFALTFSLLMIAPVFIWFNMPFMFGYMNTTVYHNPTYHVMKLFVIPVFFLALRVIDPQPYSDLRRRVFLALVAALLVMLMTLGKPNYTICLLPGLGLYVLYRLLKRQPIDWLLLILGIGLPALWVLGFQYVVAYGKPNISVAPGYSQSLQDWTTQWKIPFQFCVSILFPALVYGLHFAQARRTPYLNLAWVILFIGAFQMYFLYETGPRERHGNFIYGGYAASFVLMFVSVIFLLREYGTITLSWRGIAQLDWKFKLIGIVFALHVISGIRYYLAMLQYLPDPPA
jgi:hypothetical protein